MCRSIKPLHNFEPPATAEEIDAAALQFVRKISGYARPPKRNEQAFDTAVSEVAEAARKLLSALEATAPPRNRDVELAKARERFAARQR